MRHTLIISALTVAMLGPATLDAQAAAAPTPQQLKRALITKWHGKKAGLVRSGTAKSVVAGQTSWAFSRLPARCKTSATAGLLFTPGVARHLSKRPAAYSTMSTRGSFFGETLISAPSVGQKMFRQVVPARCGRLKVNYDGKRITVKVVKVTDLPDIPGATVSAVKTTLSPSPWKHLRQPEFMVTVVRSGSLVMETFADASDGAVETTANAFTVAAWQRATDRLG